MKALKRTFLMMTAAGSLFYMTSCGSEDDGLNHETAAFDDVAIDTEASMDAAFEDVDIAVEAGISAEGAEGGKFWKDPVLDCAEVTHDGENQTVTIDYGDGCEGPGGRIRSGKILISYTGHRREPGATRTVTFENFYIDSIRVEGTRRMTNITADSTSAPQFRTQVIDGRLTWPDSTFATRNAEHTRTWVRGDNPSEDESQLEGSAEGLTREGDAYTSVITETLVFKRRCMGQRNHLPVSGTVDKTVGESITIIDFGDGECDNEATVSIDGETETITLDAKARKHEAKNRGRRG